jgi:hypothetical protein
MTYLFLVRGKRDRLAEHHAPPSIALEMESSGRDLFREKKVRTEVDFL